MTQTKRKATDQRLFEMWREGYPLRAACFAFLDPVTERYQASVREGFNKIGEGLGHITQFLRPADEASSRLMAFVMALTPPYPPGDDELNAIALRFHCDPASQALLDQLAAGSVTALGYEFPRKTGAPPVLIPSMVFVTGQVDFATNVVEGEGYRFHDVRVADMAEAEAITGSTADTSGITGARSRFKQLFADLDREGSLPVKVTEAECARLRQIAAEAFPVFAAEIARTKRDSVARYLREYRESVAKADTAIENPPLALAQERRNEKTRT